MKNIFFIIFNTKFTFCSSEACFKLFKHEEKSDSSNYDNIIKGKTKLNPSLKKKKKHPSFM